MQVKRRNMVGQRGLAMIESAVFLPLFLLLLFGIIWAAQSGVQSERVQIAVRYSGLISNQAVPYQNYSLYALYIGAAAPATNTACSIPTSDALTNSGTFPGPQSATFWQPVVGSTKGTCSKGTVVLQGGNLTSSLLFIHTLSTSTTQVTVPGNLQAALGPNSTLYASENFFDTPDLPTMMNCFSDLHTAVNASLSNVAQNAIAAAAPIPDNNPTTTLTITGC